MRTWRNVFLGSQKGASPVEHRVPNGTRVYCVGDIHGRDDLLDNLCDRVQDDLRRGSYDEALTIFIGDYIDRGPGSSRVITRLAGADWPTRLIPLLGNHEDALLTFLDEPSALEAWRNYGALETLLSYGVGITGAISSRGYRTVHEQFLTLFPNRDRTFLSSLRLSAEVGDYFFCHAGIRPGVPLDQQERADLLMIRDPFLSSTRPSPKLIVHGHTPVELPDVRTNRIDVDTGAYASGRLTCLVLDGAEHRFIMTGDY